MGRLKKIFLVKFKASSLTEVIVATTILLVVFAISLVTLNNIMMSSVRKDSGAMETKIEKLMYQYQNKQLKVPVSYTDANFVISIQKIAQNELEFIEFSITNSISKKTVTKKQFFYENQ
jgi:hypothetical protein